MTGYDIKGSKNSGSFVWGIRMDRSPRRISSPDDDIHQRSPAQARYLSHLLKNRP